VAEEMSETSKREGVVMDVTPRNGENTVNEDGEMVNEE